MPSSNANSSSAMDVHLEPQSQLLSRIQYVIKTRSQFSILFGKSGVGKSFVTNMLVESIATTFVIELRCPKKFNYELLEQDLICQLATDELSDMRCSMTTAIQKAMDYYGQSILIIIDNAHCISQDFLSAVWNSFNEALVTLQTPQHKLNILLVGGEHWAKPTVEQLQGINKRFVSAFELSYLSNEHAIDFLTSIHPDWSAQKIKNHVSHQGKEPLTPQRLIFTEQSTVTSTSFSWKIPVVVLLMLLVSVVLGLSLYSNESIKTPEVVKQLPPKIIVLSEKQQQSDAKLFKSDNLDPVEPVINQQQSLPTTAALTPVIQKNTPVTKLTESTKLVSDVTRKDDVNNSSKSTQQSEFVSDKKTSYLFDEQKLLMISESQFSLMVGGYSNELVLRKVIDKIVDKADLYAYKTIRNGKEWFVLLYGDFADKASAQRALDNAPSKLAFSSPWIKSFRVIHAEITAVAATMDNNN